MINLPNDLTSQKRFRRIVDIMIDAVDDDVADLAEVLLAEADAPAPPSPDEDIEAYDRWLEVHLEPVQSAIYTALGQFMDFSPE